MPGSIPGYNYDIFISYRQNDNKYDGWVTEFVANLNKELEATLKDRVTVYFDSNPHDGLLETHSVDRSLEEKLRCLIFIPILSRTYCDPKSYAWNNEFLAFLNIAKEDNIGLNVKLSSGNVASRVLPVRIHDLNPEDVSLVESQIGIIRAIDFVYREPGVNRPLRVTEENPNDNLNKTHYRNQINKVANAIDEIIRGLQIAKTAVEGGKSKHDQSAGKYLVDDQKRGSAGDKRGKSKKWLIVAISVILFIIGVFAIYKVFNSGKQIQELTKQDKSIAVLPFADDSPGKDNDYLCNGMMEEILNQLQKIGDLKVKSRTSVEKYRNPDKDIKVIGKELGVSLIMEGSIRKIGDDLRIATQLIDAKTGDHLWSEIYDGKYTTDIFEFQGNIAKKVAASLNAFITPDEEKRIDIEPTTEMKAYDLCARGGEMFTKWNHTRRDTGFLRAGINYYNQALKIDPLYAKAYSGKANLFREEGRYDSAIYYLNKANSIDPYSYHVLGGLGILYMFANMPDSSLKYLKKTVDLYPNEMWANAWMGQLTWFNMRFMDLTKAFIYYQKAFNLGGDSDPEINRHIGFIYSTIGEYQKAFSYFKKSASLSSDCQFVKEACLMLVYQERNADCFSFLDSIYYIMPCRQECDAIRFLLFTKAKEFGKAEEYYNKALQEGYIVTEEFELYYAYLLRQTGRKKEALSILKKSIDRDKNLLKIRIEPFNTFFINARLAASYALLEDKEMSIKYLRDLSNLTIAGFYSPVTFNIFPGFDFLRTDPLFIELEKLSENERVSLRAQVKQMELRGEINL
jgi:TolB-like protein/tetratricopeptide (TPR) repeat protein